MTRGQARESARDILQIVPLVMRTVAAELRAAGELPAPAHFGLLLVSLDAPSRRRLHHGLGVLRKVFAGKLPGSNGLSRKGNRTSPRRRPYVSQ